MSRQPQARLLAREGQQCYPALCGDDGAGLDEMGYGEYALRIGEEAPPMDAGGDEYCPRSGDVTGDELLGSSDVGS